jgi:hypothetical protein
MSNDLLDFDICCGRGKGKWNSPGNHRFKELIQNFLPEYAEAKAKADKSRIVETVVSLIQEGGGRFVKQDEITGKWYPINSTQTRSKVAHAIRDHLATFCKKKLIPTPSQAHKASKRSKLASSDESDDDDKIPNKHQRPPQSSDSSSSGSECTPEPESQPSSRLFQYQQQPPLFHQQQGDQLERAVAVAVADPMQYSMPLQLVGPDGRQESLSDAANNSMHINNQFMNAQSLYAQNLLSLRNRQMELLFNTVPSGLASRPTSVARIDDDSETFPSRRHSQQPMERSNSTAGWPSWLPSSATDETISGGYLNHFPLQYHQVVAEDEKLNYNDPLMGPNFQEIVNLPRGTGASTAAASSSSFVGGGQQPPPARTMSLTEARFAFGWSNQEGIGESNQPSGTMLQGHGPFAVPLEVPSHAVVPNIAHSNDFQYRQHDASRLSQQGWDPRSRINSNNNNLELMRIPPVRIQPVPVPPPVQGDDAYIADLEPNAVFPPYL